MFMPCFSSSQEKRFNALLSLVPRNRVGHDHRVEMTKMRQTVGVINRCGDVESFHASYPAGATSGPSPLLLSRRSIIHSVERGATACLNRTTWLALRIQ